MSSISEDRQCHPGTLCPGGFMSSPGPPAGLSNPDIVSQPAVSGKLGWHEKIEITSSNNIFMFVFSLLLGPQVCCCLFLWLYSFAGKSSDQNFQESNTNRRSWKAWSFSLAPGIPSFSSVASVRCWAWPCRGSPVVRITKERDGK